MPQEVGLVAVFDDKNFQQGVQRYATGVAKVEQDTTRVANTVTRSASGFRNLGETVDRSGRQAMIGMRSFAEFAQMAGVDKGLSDTVYQAANATDAVGDLAGAFAMLSPAMLAVTVVGTSIAFLFNQIQNDAKQAAEEVAKLREPFIETRKEIESLTQLKGLDAMAKDLGVSTEALRQYIQQNKQISDNAYILSRAQEELAVKSNQLSDIEKQLANDERQLNELMNQGTANERARGFGSIALKQHMAALQQQARDLRTEISILNTAEAESTTGIQTFAKTQQNQTLITEFERQRWQAVRDASTQIAKIEGDLASQRASIWANAASSISSIQSGLTRTLSGYDRDYARQMEQFSKDEVKIAQDAAKAISDAYRDAAQQAAEVERDRAASLAQVDREQGTSLRRVDEDLWMSLRNARSARERRTLRLQAALQKKRIVEDAAMRKQDIDQQAAERQQQIVQRRNERIAEINTERAERMQQLRERRQEAAKELAQRKQDARDAAAEQIRQAGYSAAEQVRIAQNKAEREKQIVRNELTTIVNDVNSRIKALGGSVAASGLSLGTQIITNMAAAIRSGQSVITDALKAVVNKAVADAGRVITPPPGTEPQMYQSGGWVHRTGGAIVHAGEYVLNRRQAVQLAPLLMGANNSRTYNFTNNWHGSPASFDTRQVERIAEEAAYRGVSRAIGSG